MTNTSSGASAGSTVQLNGSIVKWCMYSVLDTTAEMPSSTGGYESDSSGNYYYKVVTDTQRNMMKRAYALAQIYIQANTSNPPNPGPGWIVPATVQGAVDSNGNSGEEIIPIATLKSSGSYYVPATQTQWRRFHQRRDSGQPIYTTACRDKQSAGDQG